MANFNVFITNLQQYTYGNMCGEWVSLPCTKEQMQAVFDRNEINEDSGYFFTDYDLPLTDMNRDFGEFQRIDELNYLAVRIYELEPEEFDKLSEIVKSGIDTFDSPTDYINLIMNLDCFTLVPASNEYELGEYLIETNIDESVLKQNIPGIINIGDYLDYERIGSDAAINMYGMFGDKSFVVKNSSYKFLYNGEVPYEFIVQPENPFKADYQFLDRLRTDCNYFLGHGYAVESKLWAGNVEKHIEKMQEIYDKLPKNGKPEWLTQDDIYDYKYKMIEARNLKEFNIQNNMEM